MNVQEIWISTKVTSKTATEILRLALGSVGALIHTKRSARKARAAFRRMLIQQGLPNEAVDILTSAYGEQLRKLTSIWHWMKQFKH